MIEIDTTTGEIISDEPMSEDAAHYESYWRKIISAEIIIRKRNDSVTISDAAIFNQFINTGIIEASSVALHSLKKFIEDAAVREAGEAAQTAERIAVEKKIVDDREAKIAYDEAHPSNEVDSDGYLYD